MPTVVLAGRAGELVLGDLVGDQHDATRAERLARGAERLDRVREVVQHLEHRRDVVAGAGQRCRVADLVRDPVRHALLLGDCPGRRDRRFVEVDAVDPYVSGTPWR